MNSSACDHGNPMPSMRIVNSDFSHQMTHKDLQSRAGLAMHAFLPIHISLNETCLDEKVGVSHPRELLIVPKFSTKMGGAIHLSTDAVACTNV